jgi:Sec-independent protein secretion pathway component TatC
MSEGTQELERQRREVPVGVIMVGMSLVVWWPAFTIGVYSDLFFDQILTLWAASTAAFVFVLVERQPVGARLARASVLLLPSAYIVLMFVVGETNDVLVAIVDLAAIGAVLIGIPFTLWVLVRIVWPDFSTVTSRRTKWLIVGVVLGIAITSFVLGLNQEHFLTCEDFRLSGNLVPDDCTPAPALEG